MQLTFEYFQVMKGSMQTRKIKKNIQTHCENSIIQIRGKHCKVTPDNLVAYMKLQQTIFNLLVEPFVMDIRNKKVVH